jgi:ATP-dependent RNA helicase SUPV3L1/SUV3
VEALAEATSGPLAAPAIAAGAVIDPVPETPAEAAPAMIEIWRPGRPRPERRPERKRPNKEEAKAGDAAAPAAGEAKPGERPRGPRPDKRGKDRNKGRDKRRDGDAAQFKPRPERREKPIDPNSPFASLMALKERLEAGNKDKG